MPTLPRGRLRWFGRARITEGGEQTEAPAALIEFEDTVAQQQFVNSGVMGLEFDDDTMAFVLDSKPLN